MHHFVLVMYVLPYWIMAKSGWYTYMHTNYNMSLVYILTSAVEMGKLGGLAPQQ